MGYKKISKLIAEKFNITLIHAARNLSNIVSTMLKHRTAVSITSEQLPRCLGADNHWPVLPSLMYQCNSPLFFYSWQLSGNRTWGLTLQMITDWGSTGEADNVWRNDPDHVATTISAILTLSLLSLIAFRSSLGWEAKAIASASEATLHTTTDRGSQGMDSWTINYLSSVLTSLTHYCISPPTFIDSAVQPTFWELTQSWTIYIFVIH